MHKQPRPAGPSPYALSARLSKIPLYLMMQTMRTNFAYRAAVNTHFPDTSNEEALRFPHYAAMIILDESGPMSQKELSQRLRFDASDLVSIIDDLEKIEYVTRERDASDRRRYQLRVTTTGLERLKQRDKETKLSAHMFFSPLSSSEYDQLCDMLQRLDEFHREHFDENALKLAEQLSKLKN